MIMDMQIGVFCGVFSIIASVIVYAVLSFYSIKEDSFDEARANRRKLIKEYMDQSRSNFDKTKQKKTKKNIKKGKDKKPDVVDEDMDDHKENNHHDAIKEQQAKEITQNRKIETLNVVKNSIKTKIHTLSNVEKDIDINLGSNLPNETSFKKVTDKKLKVKSFEKTSDSENIVEPLMKDIEKKNKSETKVEKKKQTDISAVRKVISTEKQVINVNSVLTVVRKAELSRSEIQLLIDTLLNSYEDETSDWLKVKKLDSGRQDSTSKLKKQLLELETSLKNEKQITSSLQGKLKELRTDMASDKSSVTLLKETVNRMQQEKDDLIYEKNDLSSRLKSISLEKEELQEQLNHELIKVKHLQKQDDDHRHEAITALKKQTSLLNTQLESAEKENSTLKSNVDVLEEEMKFHKNCQERINDFEKTVNMMKEKIEENEHELNAAKQHMTSLNSVMEEVKSENQDLKREREQLTSQLSLYCNEIQNLKEEIDTKSMKLAEIQNAQKNGDVAECYDNKHDPLKCEYLLEEKENLLKHLNSELDKKTDSLNELTVELKKINTENKKLASYVDEAIKENSTLKMNMHSQIDDLEETISKLRNNMNEKNCELLSLNTEVEKYKQRNNELRNKNWKLVEALTEREKALQSKLKSEETLQNKIKLEEVGSGGNCYKTIDELKNNVNTFVRRLFPNIEIQEHNGQFNDWLRSVEETVNANNTNHFSEDLQLQNTQLQSLVAHYKNIISDTEDMLYKLQNHIEVEESKWKEEISNMQKELENLRSLQRNSVQ